MNGYFGAPFEKYLPAGQDFEFRTSSNDDELPQ
jgi:hypothetical protein